MADNNLTAPDPYQSTGTTPGVSATNAAAAAVDNPYSSTPLPQQNNPIQTYVDPAADPAIPVGPDLYAQDFAQIPAIYSQANVYLTQVQENITQRTTVVQGGDYGNANVSAYLAVNTGNISAEYFLGDGSQLTGISALGNFIVNGSSKVDVVTPGGNVVIGADGNEWTFGGDGNLTLPDNTSSINYANGSPYGGSSVSIVPNDVTYGTGSLYGNANPGFTVVAGHDDDDDAYAIPLDFPLEFLGNSYSDGNVFLVSNSYLTFGPDDYTSYHPVGPVEIPVPAIFVGSTDLSNQKYYYGYADGTDVFVIGYEGSIETSGQEDYPAIKWELQVNSATPDQIKIVVDGPGYNGGALNFPAGVWGVSDGAEWIDQYQPLPWYSNNNDNTYNAITIAPVTPVVASTIAFTGPGVTYSENGSTTFINIDPFDQAISVGYDDDSSEAIISSTYYDLKITTARDGDDLTLAPLGDVNVAAGSASDNQPGGGYQVNIYGGNAHDNPTDPGQNYSGGNVLIGGGDAVGNGAPGLVNIVSNGKFWTFAPTGGTIFPTLTTQRGDDPSATITGQTLLFGDAAQEAIISTADGTVSNEYSQRLVINPGKGYDYGEGGDIYLWAGRGGDGSGTGGDIKIRGGQGGANTMGGSGGAGGYIRMEAGDAAVDGQAGYIEITGGYGNAQGGNVTITGGYGGNGGNVLLSSGGYTWTVGHNSKITLPFGASLNDTSGESVAFGQNAGLTSQDRHAVAVGASAGSLYQGEDSIAIGYQAGNHDQRRGVAIGYQAGVGGTLYKSVNTFHGGSGPVTTYSDSAPPNSSRLYVASTTNIEVNQRVFGNNIQANTVVTDVISGEDRVDISLPYTAAMSSGDTLTFVGLVIGLDNSTNVTYGMRVTGTDIPANTFVQSTGCSTVTLNQYPTAPLVEPNGLQFDIGQGAYSTAVGYRAGSSFQDDGAVAIGYQAGSQNQSTRAVAVGEFAGYSNQSANAVAVGESAGEFTQSVNAVAVGYKAGNYQQGPRAVAIGEDAGYNTQGEDAVAVGQKAGFASQGQMAIAIGNTAGYSGQAQEAVAIGYGTGLVSQQYAAVAIGANAASYNQGSTAVAVGHLAGNTSQGSSAVAVGDGAGYNVQSGSAVAVGTQSGYNYQSQYAVAIGAAAGQGQGYSAVYQSGTGTAITITPNADIKIGQRITGLYVPADTYVVDIVGASLTLSQAITGTPAVDTVWTAWGQQGISAVAIGQNAGDDFQGNNAVAIGREAGYDSQGANSVAIGSFAGQSAQGNNSIILNATGANLNQTTANTFTVAPIRASTLNNYSLDTGNVLYYNTSTHEITTAPANNIAGDPLAVYSIDSTANVTVWTASSDEVVGAKMTVRVVYFSAGWQNTEMLDIMIAKNYPDGTPAFTVSNRVKTNPAYQNVPIDVTLTGGNIMQVISSAPDGAGNNVYWTYSVTSFNQTFD